PRVAVAGEIIARPIAGGTDGSVGPVPHPGERRLDRLALLGGRCGALVGHDLFDFADVGGSEPEGSLRAAAVRAAHEHLVAVGHAGLVTLVMRVDRSFA